MFKSYKHFVLFVLSLLIFSWESFSQDQMGIVHENKQYASQPSLRNKDIRNLIEQNQLERQGRAFEKEGLFEEALEKYVQAADIGKAIGGFKDVVPSVFIVRVHQKQGKLEQSLDEVNQILKYLPQQEFYTEWQSQLVVLIKARNTKNIQPIYEHIDYLKNKYRKQLPPKRVVAGISDAVASTIIRLYDHIGDHDSGIKFMDEFINYYSKIWKIKPEVLEGPGSKNQYFLIKKAFLQDKAEGFKGCIQAKPGEVCMGRATKALIDSDYFPW